jgi:CBS domain-containing protein
MNCGNLLDASFPTLQLTDTVNNAREYIGEEACLVVLLDQQYKGVLNKDDFDGADDALTLESFTEYFTQTCVADTDFFLGALRKMREQHIAYLPVVSLTGAYLGMITQEAIIDVAAQYLNAVDPGGVIILQMPPHQFSISELGRIVESNNAKILHLTTWTDVATGSLMVSMKVNKVDIQDILASFERYQFNVYQYFGENLSEETLKSNFDNLMNYLRMYLSLMTQTCKSFVSFYAFFYCY